MKFSNLQGGAAWCAQPSVSLALGLTSVLLACSGSVGSNGASDSSLDEDGAEGATTKGEGKPTPVVTSALCKANTADSSPLARLTNRQYANTLRDLFPGIELPPLTLSPEVGNAVFDTDVMAQNPSESLIGDFHSNAKAVATKAVADAGGLLGGCKVGTSSEQDTCVATFLQSFGKRAFRRPLTPDEHGKYLQVFKANRDQSDFKTGLSLTLQSLLQSPHFLYRVVLGSPAASHPGAAKLNSYEVASRLSYVIWNSMPDANLFAAADSEKLGTAAAIKEQGLRMLDDVKAHETVATFHSRWLNLDQITAVTRDQKLFPKFTKEAAASLRPSVEKFVEEAFWSKGTYKNLLTDSHAYVNSALAPLYGVAARGGTMEAVELDSRQRAGLLTQVGLLATLAHETVESPVKRGYFVLDRLLCSAPPPAPNDVNTALPEVKATDGPKTTRALFQAQHEVGSCVSCHRSIDGIGFGFEAYDAAGQHRSTEAGAPVDESGELVGTDVDGPFNGPIELSNKLADSKAAQRCVVQQWFRYAFGRLEADEDTCAIDHFAKNFAATGTDMRGVLVDLVTSDTFRYRITLGSN